MHFMHKMVDIYSFFLFDKPTEAWYNKEEMGHSPQKTPARRDESRERKRIMAVNNGIFIRFPNGLEKALTLSYDDGVYEDIRLVEIMQKHGLRGTFNVNAELYADKEYIPTGEKTWGKRLTREQVTELFSREGVEPAMHGKTHAHLQTMPMPQAIYEVIQDRALLEKQFGHIVRGMAYAYGTYNDESVQALRDCGILFCRGTIPSEDTRLPVDWLRLKPTCHHNHPKMPELCDRFLKLKVGTRDDARMFYLWGHSYEFERDDNWDRIEQFAEKMGGHEDIWYATNTEIFEYVEAFKALRFTVDMEKAYNPTATPLWFIFHETLYEVGAGQTVDLH